MSPAPGRTPHFHQALLTFRIIGASLGVGVTMFAFVSWFLHLQNGASDVGIDEALMVYAMLGLAFLAAVAAIAFWRARVGPLIESARADADPARHLAEVQTHVIIVWAIMEMPALLAEVVYFLSGNVLAGVLGVAIIWTAIGATWPKREWFAA